MEDLDTKILKNKIDEKRFRDKGWGNDEIILNDKHIRELKKGNKIGYYDGEYTKMISYEDKE